MTDRSDPRSLGELIADLPRHLSALIRKEFDLLRAEMSEKAAQLRASAIALGVSAVVALVALNMLAGALVAALVAWGVPPGWAALIVGGVLLLIALVLLRSGLAGLRAGSLVPERSIDAARKSAAALKEDIR